MAITRGRQAVKDVRARIEGQALLVRPGAAVKYACVQIEVASLHLLLRRVHTPETAPAVLNQRDAIVVTRLGNRLGCGPRLAVAAARQHDLVTSLEVVSRPRQGAVGDPRHPIIAFP